MEQQGAPTQQPEAQVPPPANQTETTPPPAQPQPEATQQQPPQPEATPSQEQTEAEKRAEILKGRQEDINKISSILFKRKLQEANSPDSKMSSEQKKRLSDALTTIEYARVLADTRREKTDQHGNAIPLLDNRQLGTTRINFTATNSESGKIEDIRIRSIISGEGEIFSCEANVDGVIKTIDVSKDMILKSVINSELPNIKGDFSVEEQQLLQTYLDQNNGNPDILLQEDTRDIMESVAKQMGMLRVDDMNAFVDSGLARPNIQTQEAEDLQLLRSALSADRVLVTPDILKVAFSHMGLGQEGYLQMQMRARVDNEQLVAQLSRLDQSSTHTEVQARIAELQKQIADNNANAEQAARILEVLNDPQAIDTLAQNITNGELDLDTSKQIVDAVRANDFDALLDANPETRIDPNDSADVQAAKQKKREYLKTMGKGSGVLLLILMSMITEIGPEFTK